LHSPAIDQDFSFNAQKIVFVRTEGLAHGDVAVRVLIGKCACGGIPACDIQGLIQFLFQVLVIGEERERIAKLAGDKLINQFKRLARVVRILVSF
jgi:hypothetical protein